jgi:hypothetical protein
VVSNLEEYEVNDKRRNNGGKNNAKSPKETFRGLNELYHTATPFVKRVRA